MKHAYPLLAVLAVAVLALVPNMTGGYWTNVMALVLLNVTVVSGLNLVTGYAGLFSFAQAAFYAIGAYTTAIMARDLGTSIWINLPVACLVSAAFGALLAMPALRLKGHFLAIVTIAFQTIVYLVLSQWNSFTGGQNGLSIQGASEFFGVRLFRIHHYYYLALFLAVVVLALVWLVIHSRMGREWMAIRDDETLARAVGIPAGRAKLTAFAASAGIAGASGVVYAHMMRGVTPDDFTIWLSASLVAMMIVGGKGTFFGPILGAALLTITPELLGKFAEYKMFLFGIVLVVSATVLPNGLAGLWKALRSKQP